MKSISADQAFQAYEAARHRLPAVEPSDRRFHHIESLEEVADEFDVFLLDAFGVLNIGDEAIPGTRERIDRLKENGKSVLVVSNAASVPPSDLVAKYRRIGYDFELDDIVTSRATMAAAMKTMNAAHWGVMGGGNGRLEDLGTLRTTPLADDPATYREVAGFLLIGSGRWTESRQAILEAALKSDPRPVLVANPDIVAPRVGGFSAEPGHYAHRLADTTGIAPVFYGKPFTGIFELAFARLGSVDKGRVLMVGDSLHTDILGAHAIGVASALVAHFGFFAGRDVPDAIERAGIVPDYVIDRP